MVATRQRTRILFGTKHGLTLLGRNWALYFGLLSGAAQLVLACWPNSPGPRWPALLGLTAMAATCAVCTSFPRTTVSRGFTHPDVTVTVQVGDLFAYPCHLVIGFTDTFDTDTTDASLVAPRSVQGQLLHRMYHGDVAALDARLAEALTTVVPTHTEPRTAKRLGKLVRYPIGTVVTIRNRERNYFCVAYGRMTNDLVVDCDTEQLWNSLALLWETVRRYGHLDHVAMPVTGSDLARINNMDQASLVKLILLSFVAHSRARGVCGSLTIVVRPQDYYKIDMIAMAAFLRSL